MPLLNLEEIWPKLKYSFEKVCQRNSSKTAQQNVVKLCSYEEHSCTGAYSQKILLWFFPESTIKTFAKIYHFMQLVWNRFTMNDREAVQSDIFLTVNIQMLHKCDNNMY